MSKGVSIYGSTGSIGRQALEVADELKRHLRVVTLVANRSSELLAEQALKFKPRYAVILDESKVDSVNNILRGTGIDVLAGKEAAIKACTGEDTDIVLNSAVGVEGLEPTIEFIKAKKTIALANKESIVTGGHLVIEMAKDHGVRILPVDSEHSAIFQCLNGNNCSKISRLIITASGGPFRGKQRNELENATPEEALRHPTWKMGERITIDCATLMNKGFEVIEAKWLFGVPADQIDVVIHPQSIVHASVEYADGSQINQTGLPSMKLPIQYALTYPARLENNHPRLNLPKVGPASKMGVLEFMEPDMETFGCLKLAYEVARSGGLGGAVLNGADEMAVQLFLDRTIKFLEIEEVVGMALAESKNVLKYNPINPLRSSECDYAVEFEAIKAADAWAKDFTINYIRDKRHA